MSIPLETFLCPKNMRSLKSTSKALGILFYTYSNLNLPLILSTNHASELSDFRMKTVFPISIKSSILYCKYER